MSQKIALFGAGGKMGVRLSKNLLKSSFQVAHVEPSPHGQKKTERSTWIGCSQC